MTDPTTPTTEAGCALLETIAIAERLSPNGVRVRNYIPPILAIEAEAARQERARLAEAAERLDPEDPESVEAMVRTLYRFYAGPSREHDPAYWQTRARNVLSAFVHWRGEVAREWKASAAPTEETPHE